MISPEGSGSDCSSRGYPNSIGLAGGSATVGAPPAIANAVVDALRHLGVTHLDIPITPEKVWTILKNKGVAE